MNSAKKARLEGAGWKVGTAAEFLGLNKQEAAFVEMKLALARCLHALRIRRKLSQSRVARPPPEVRVGDRWFAYRGRSRSCIAQEAHARLIRGLARRSIRGPGPRPGEPVYATTATRYAPGDAPLPSWHERSEGSRVEDDARRN